MMKQNQIFRNTDNFFSSPLFDRLFAKKDLKANFLIDFGGKLTYCLKYCTLVALRHVCGYSAKDGVSILNNVFAVA